MDLGLKGKVAAVSGASQGIGYAIALGLAAEGADVSISARGRERLDRAVTDLRGKGVKALGVQCDLATPAGCQKFIEDTVVHFGGLDILVNNVGGMVPGTLETLSEQAWRDILDRNLMSYVWCTRAAVPHLKKRPNAKILNVSGMSGKQLLPGSLSTTLPNTAIIGFSKLMAGELAPSGILVNNICPGIVNTEAWGPRAEALAKVRNMTPDEVRKMFSDLTLLGRWAEPQEVADVATFLVSERNNYMTGTTVEVCGGWSRYI
jgi:3-oxoacyl-[acyl-carrier protein] reductase